MAVDPRKTLFNSDYQSDKIVYFKEGTFITTDTIQHGLSFTPLVFGVWSTDSDFSSVNTLGELDTGTDPGYVPVLSAECQANSTTISLQSAGNTQNSTLFYRVYAFEPDDSTADVAATSDKAKTFILNTDYNYCKLKDTGVFTQANQEFSHNLGYIPQVMAWVRFIYPSTFIQPLSGASEFTNYGLTVTTNKLIFGNIPIPGLIDKIYWRIYYDEA